MSDSLSNAQAQKQVVLLLERHYHRSERAIRVDSPPGAGKTWLIQRMAVLSSELLRERCLIVVQTNAQAIDLIERFCSDFPNVPLFFIHSQQLILPSSFRLLKNLLTSSQFDALPEEHCLVIATASRCAWTSSKQKVFDVMLVDEAFQLPDYRFQIIASLGKRHVLIGDPGQIAPIVKAQVHSWDGSPTAPHLPCPVPLLARHPKIAYFQIPITRRLPQDTVRFLQPLFYPNHSFCAWEVDVRDEHMRLQNAIEKLDVASKSSLSQLSKKGASLFLLELEGTAPVGLDQPLMKSICSFIRSFLPSKLNGKEHFQSKFEQGSFKASELGIACPHISQVAMLQNHLQADFPDLYIETVDRFQGLEKKVMFIVHPLSGRQALDAFHLDTGRMCVALSRHRTACFLFTRVGLDALFSEQSFRLGRNLLKSGERFFRDIQIHRGLLLMLAEEGRRLPIKVINEKGA